MIAMNDENTCYICGNPTNDEFPFNISFGRSNGGSKEQIMEYPNDPLYSRMFIKQIWLCTECLVDRLKIKKTIMGIFNKSFYQDLMKDLSNATGEFNKRFENKKFSSEQEKYDDIKRVADELGLSL